MTKSEAKTVKMIYEFVKGMDTRLSGEIKNVRDELRHDRSGFYKAINHHKDHCSTQEELKEFKNDYKKEKSELNQNKINEKINKKTFLRMDVSNWINFAMWASVILIAIFTRG
jgi:hypothetical protein